MTNHDIAFVLGGGGLLGANEVGMLRALLEEGVRPDLVVGTSVGAINGAAIAFDPTPAAVEKLIEVWRKRRRHGPLRRLGAAPGAVTSPGRTPTCTPTSRCAGCSRNSSARR